MTPRPGRMQRRLAVAAAAAAVAAAAAAVAGCGGDQSEAVPVPPPVERAVRAVFADYTAAMRARDYARACRHLAPESIAGLREAVARLGRKPPRRCGDMLALTTGSANPQERRQLAEVTRTAKVDGVFEIADRDDAVSIAWAGTVDGKRIPVQQAARLVRGRWKLVGAGR